LIEDADVFQLFWSRNSMHSPHCRDEWEHALALPRDKPLIRPLYWEDPLPADPGQELPPAGLRELHFVKVPAVPEPLGSEWPAASPRAEAPAQPAPPAPGTMTGRAPGGGRRGRKRWLGLAAGLAAAVVVAVGVIPRLVATSLSGPPAASAPQPATPTAAAPSASSTGRQLTASQLLPGDCLTGSNLQLNTSGQWPTLVQAVPCDQEHTAEVYYSSNYWPADQAYPGERVKLRQATVRCNKAFHSYVGIPYSQSVFAKTVITPSQAGWDSGDRQLTCIAYKPTNKYPGGAPLHASIRGTAR